MLTDEGREVANDCITRSGLPTLDILSDDEMVDPAQQPNNDIPSDILDKVPFLELQCSYLETSFLIQLQCCLCQC